ncbi:MAG: ABC transporter permease [Halodesulfurarchaeum sp.]
MRSEKTIVLALLIQLFVASFSSFLVVGLVSLYDPGATQGAYSVDIGVSGAVSDALVASADRGSSRSAVVYTNRTRAITAFRNRRIDAVLLAERTGNGGYRVRAIVPRGDFRTTFVVVQVKRALSGFERRLRLSALEHLERRPVPVPPKTDANPYFSFTYTILVPMLAFLPAFISGSIAADSLAEELERGTLELLQVSPLSVSEIIDGKALAMVAIAPAQAGLWFLFLAWNGTTIANPLLILVLVAALAGLLVVLGSGLALLVQVRREAQLLYSLLALAVFGSSLLLPESLPNIVAKLAVGSPTTVTYLSVVVLSTIVPLGYMGIRQYVAMESTVA